MDCTRPLSYPCLFLLLFCTGTTPAAARQPVPCRPAKPSDRPAVVFRIGGGLTGSAREWRIFPDGLICTASGDDLTHPMALVRERWTYVENGRMPSGKVTQLIDGLSGLGFFTMARGYYDAGACHQCNRYRVTVRKGNHKRTVEGSDWKLSPEFKEVVSKIREALAAGP